MDGRTPSPDGDYAPSALPSTAARVLAFVSILVGGLCGGLIGWAFVDLQSDGDAGVDLDDVSRALEDQGVASFAKSFDELIAALETKAEDLRSGSSLPAPR
jgi:hypothetical protein